MNIAQTDLTLGQRLESLHKNWDFWVAFAWIETRSIDLLETVHEYRTSTMLLHNANHKVPVVINEVCDFGHSCGKNNACSLPQATRRKLAGVCADGRMTAYGIPSDSSHPKEIPAHYWVVEGRVGEPTELKIGDNSWSGLLFPASTIVKLFPPLGRPLGARKPSKVDLERYVKSKVKMGWNMRQICKDAKTHFLPNLPTRRSIEDAYKVLIPNPPRGAPRKLKP